MGKNDYCCAPGCSNTRNTNPELQYYRIPKEKTRRKSWLARIRRDFTPSENTRLCSGHFVDGFKSDEKASRNFVPSVFKYSHKTRTIMRTTENSIQTKDTELELAEPKSKRQRIERKTPVSTTPKGRPKAINSQDVSLDSHVVWGTCLPSDHPLKAHDYCRLRFYPDNVNVDPETLKQITDLENKVQKLEEENQNLRLRCLILDEIKHDDSKFQFWTGFPNYGSYRALFEYLESALVRKRNWRGSDVFNKADVTERKKGAPTKLSLQEEFFMVLIRLRLGLTLTDLASRFMLSEGNISKIFTTWINLMYFELKDLCQMTESIDEEKAKHHI